MLLASLHLGSNIIWSFFLIFYIFFHRAWFYISDQIKRWYHVMRWAVAFCLWFCYCSAVLFLNTSRLYRPTTQSYARIFIWKLCDEGGWIPAYTKPSHIFLPWPQINVPFRRTWVYLRICPVFSHEGGEATQPPLIHHHCSIAKMNEVVSKQLNE